MVEQNAQRTENVYFLCKAGTAGTKALIGDFMERLSERHWHIIDNCGANVRSYVVQTGDSGLDGAGVKQYVFAQLVDPETDYVKASYVNSRFKCPLAFSAMEEQITTAGGLLTQLVSVTVTTLKQVGTANAITIVSSDSGVTFLAQCDLDMHSVLGDYAMAMPDSDGHFSFAQLVQAIRHTEASNNG